MQKHKMGFVAQYGPNGLKRFYLKLHPDGGHSYVADPAGATWRDTAEEMLRDTDGRGDIPAEYLPPTIVPHGRPAEMTADDVIQAFRDLSADEQTTVVACLTPAAVSPAARLTAPPRQRKPARTRDTECP